MADMVLMFTQEGCPACKAAGPEFDRFLSRNPLVMGLKLDADGPYAPHFLGERKIRATPLYVIRHEGAREIHEGGMKAEQLEKWMRAVERG